MISYWGHLTHPTTGKAPNIEIEPSTFAEDWLRMLEDPKYSDVTFLIEGQHKVKAHQIVLCSASQFFRKVFRKTIKVLYFILL